MKRSARFHHVVQRYLGLSLVHATSLWIASGLLAPQAVHAQPVPVQSVDENNSTIQAVGESIVETAPQKLRLMLRTKAEGSNVREALDALAKHKTRVHEELVALKANPDSIQFFSDELRRSIMGVPAQFQGNPKELLPRLGRPGANANFNIDDLPPVHIATCYVEAEWTLPSADADMLVYLPLTLRDEITSRDLLGDENTRPLSAEQSAVIERFKSLLEERGSLISSYVPSQLRERDDRVQIVFATRIDPDAKARALKQAFERARDACDELAAASGSQRGRLLSISRNMTPEDVTPSSSYTYSALGLTGEPSEAVLARRNRTAHRDEISARSPELLQARIQVRATFKLSNVD